MEIHLKKLMKQQEPGRPSWNLLNQAQAKCIHSILQVHVVFFTYNQLQLFFLRIEFEKKITQFSFIETALIC